MTNLTPSWKDLENFVRGLLARRWVRFGLTGGAATLSYFLLGLLFVKQWGMFVLVGNALAYVISFIVSYLGQSRWTFGVRGNHKVALPRFAAVQAFGLLFNSLVVGICTLRGLSYEVSMLVASAAVPVLVFFLCKYWVFRQGSTASASTGPATGEGGHARAIHKDQP